MTIATETTPAPPRHGIEWLNRPGTKGESWNPIVGCSITSPGCTNCYAMTMAARLERMGTAPHYAGLTAASKAGPVWTGTLRPAPDKVLLKPLSWRQPRTVFVNSMSDLFHEAVPDAWIDRVFAVMALAPQHTFLILTKRAARMREYLQAGERGGIVTAQAIVATGGKFGVSRSEWPLPNVWIGVSAERQQEADARIPDLLATPAAVRFVSYEPALGPIYLTRVRWPDGDQRCALRHQIRPLVMAAEVNGRSVSPANIEVSIGKPHLDWVIAGGESGPGARPAHPDWFRSVRDQCAAADVPFFFKQWGNWVPELDCERDDPDGRADYQRYERNGFRILNLAGGCGFHGERVHVMRPSTKASAGHLLDGREHLAWPKGGA